MRRFEFGLSSLARQRNGTERGFGLLEALVAMAIASVSLGTLYRVVAQGSKAAVDTELRVQATLVARSVLAESAFADDFAKNARGNNGVWAWSIEVARTQAFFREDDGRQGATPVDAGKVTVLVTRDSGMGPTFTFQGWKPYRAGR